MTFLLVLFLSNSHAQSPYQFTFTQGKITTKELVCNGKNNYANLCAESQQECLDLTGASFCGTYEPVAVGARLRNESLKAKIEKYTVEKFYEIRDNPKYSEFCKGKFNETKLEILRGVPPSDHGAEYNDLTNSVRIYESRMVSAKTQEEIDQLLLHELGHSCQANRTEGTKSIRFCGSDATLAIADIQALGPGKEAECVIRTVSEENRNDFYNGIPICFAHRMLEAYASLVFVPERKKLAHWNFECHAANDETHSMPRFHQCFLTSERLQKTFCQAGAPSGQLKNNKGDK